MSSSRAVLGTLLTGRTHILATHGTAHVPALLGGYHLAFAVAAGCAFAGVVAALATLRQSRPQRLSQQAVSEIEVA